jgi:hypothetical protein
MKVTKEQIVNGVDSFAEAEVIREVDDKATHILAAIFIRYVKAKTKLVDSIFESQTVKTFLKADESGMYEIDELFQIVTESIRQYGPFPVEIPPIPFISPSEKTLKFNEADVSEIKKRIERSN